MSSSTPGRIRVAWVTALTALAATGLTACVPDEYGRLAAIKTGDLSGAPAPRASFELDVSQACGAPELTEAGASALLRQPYLQRVTDSSALLTWTSAASQPAVVSWRLADDQTASWTISAAASDSTATVPGGAQYSATLATLQAGRTYCYRLQDAGGAVLVSAGFRAAPAPASGDLVRFSAVADMGGANPDQAAVIAAMKTVRSDLVLAPGDIAYDDGTLSQFEQNYFRPFAEMVRVLPFFPASGNHEYHTSDAEPFRQVFSLPENGGEHGRERWYSFDWGPVHFVVLDTERVGPTQAIWLNNDLATNRLPWTIVAMHRPPFSSGAHGSADDVRALFVPILEHHGVAAVLSGHDHDYERTKPINGVTYIVTGGGGGHGTKPVGSSDFTAFSEQVSEFLYGEVDRDELHLHAIDGTGREFDSVTIKRPAAPQPLSLR